MKITKADLIIKNGYDGKIIISAIVGLSLVMRRYYGYSKKEAVSLFLAEVNR